MELMYDYVLKVIMVGDSGVGKSSLLLRFADDIYQDHYISTIGVDLRIRTVEVNGARAKLHIWDTAGQERFKTVCAQYYRGAHAIVIAYDITNPESFLRISTWLAEIKPHMREDCLLLIIGLKSDLAETKRMVTQEEAMEVSKQLNIPALEASAKNNTNVTEAFMTLAEQMCTQFGTKTLTPSTPVMNPGFDFQKPKKSSLNCFECTLM